MQVLEPKATKFSVRVPRPAADRSEREWPAASPNARETVADAQEMLELLCRLAIVRDRDTGNHILRMAQIAGCLAVRYGLSEMETRVLIRAAPLHDIGKIAIPDAILLKRSALDADEQRVMRTHCQIGHDLIKGFSSPELMVGADIALNHHERWDGNGYPNNKQGEEISIQARIVTVADVLDALVSLRPYKKAWRLDDALDLIQAGSGKQFDPEVVSCIRPCLCSIEEILELFRDE